MLPLPALLSRALGHLRTELEEESGAGPAVASLAVWSNVLRCVGDGFDERELPEAARLSRRMATAALTGSARRGWIALEAGPGKTRRATLTDAGRATAAVWTERLAALDASWARSPLREALEGVVGRLPFELPHFPAAYGAADPSAIGGPYVQRSKRPAGLPAHGKDWVPVRRADGDTVSRVPLTALLSQALVGFTIDYEDAFPWPLANTTTVLCHIGPQPRPLADVPGDHGITGAGKSLLERHLIAVVTRDPEDPRRKLVTLTDRGSAVLKHHPARLETVEAEWRERFGDALVAGLREALEPLATLGRDEPDHVVGQLHNG